MSETGTPLRRYEVRVAITNAHLEFVIDGDGDHFAVLQGHIERSDHDAVPVGLPFDITLGLIQAEDYGVLIGPNLGSAQLEAMGSSMEAIKTILKLARGRPDGLYVDLDVLGEPRDRGGLGVHWGAAGLHLGARHLFQTRDAA